MWCYRRDQVEDYLTGRLGPEAARHLEQHAAGCRCCGQALRDARLTRSCLQWLRPPEEPPKPGPAFYSKVQEAIERRTATGWLGNVATALHPRLAYPLLFLGVLLMAWTLTYPTEANEESLLGLPAARFSNISSSSGADQMRSRDMVMISLVELPEGD